MSEFIHIPIVYKGEEVSLQAEVLKRGYIHGFQIEINNIPIIFEPDEERNYRVIMDETKYNRNQSDLELIKEIVKTLESV